MYTYFERLLDPLAPCDIVAPPRHTVAFIRHFLWPIRWLLVITLAVSGVAALSELSIYVFLGMLVDWMTETPASDFLEAHGLALLGMILVAFVVRPVAVLASRGLSTLALVPGIGNLVRWRNHRYVLRQSLSYFQNDFAGRIAQKVMQTGPNLREAVMNVIDGVWLLVIFLIAAVPAVD